MQGNVGDVLFYDKAKKALTIIENRKLDRINVYAKRYTPIGVVVIPSSHNVYGDGSCGVMSLAEMNCDTPQQGGGNERQYMCWGEYNVKVNGLKTFDKVVICGDENSELSLMDYGYLSSSVFKGYPNRFDDNTAYRNDNYWIPSPYLTNGSRNALYSIGNRNALADFDGRGNTSNIIAQRGIKDYTTWKPNEDTEADYPAASCCDMFSTDGTKQGDWYLPSCGELGYVIARLKEINETLDKLKAAYPNTPIVSLDANNGYWSSSECSSIYARYLSTSYGGVGFVNKHSLGYVRALFRF